MELINAAVTGPRRLVNKPLDERIAIVNRICSLLEEHEPHHLYIGMAEGFDEFACHAAIKTGIPFTACIPSPGYGEYYWRDHSQTKTDRFLRFKQLVTMAREVVYVCDSHKGGRANLNRNLYMIERSQLLISYKADFPSMGTQHALRQGRRLNLNIVFTDQCLMDV